MLVLQCSVLAAFAVITPSHWAIAAVAFVGSTTWWSGGVIGLCGHQPIELPVPAPVPLPVVVAERQIKIACACAPAPAPAPAPVPAAEYGPPPGFLVLHWALLLLTGLGGACCGGYGTYCALRPYGGCSPPGDAGYSRIRHYREKGGHPPA